MRAQPRHGEIDEGPHLGGGLPAFRIDQLHRQRRQLIIREHDLQAAVAQFLIDLI